MNSLKYYIEKGTKKAGGLSKLGNLLGVLQPHMSAAKSEKIQLPLYACVKLADYINENAVKIIACSQLTTEKDLKKIEFWESVIAKKDEKVIFDKNEKVIFKKLLSFLKEIRSNKNYYFLDRYYNLFKEVVEHSNGGIKVIFHKMSVAFGHFYGRMT